MSPLAYVSIAFAVMVMGIGVKYTMLKSDYDKLIVSHAKEIKEKNSEIDRLKAKNAVSLANEAVYISTIDDLNKAIHIYKIDTASKNKELEEYKSKPDGEKYKMMFDRLSKIKETQDDCKRYEDTSNAFNGFDLNEL